MVSGLQEQGKRLFPGLIAVLGIAIICRLLMEVFPKEVGTVLGEPVLGMILGLVLGNALGILPRFEPGIRFSYSRLLPIAIVLLGAKFSFQRIVSMGWGVVFLILGLIILAMALTLTLSKLGKVSSKLGLLIGLGTAICGNTAITVSAPVIGAKDEEITFAIATNTLFGTLAVLLYPVLGHALEVSQSFFGIWAGTAVNDTSQVIAVGFSYGDQAGEIATMVKLIRNALMGLVILILGWVYSSNSGEVKLTQRLKKAVPGFLIGFLIMALLQTFGLIDQVGQILGRAIVSDFLAVSKFLILMALIGVGWSTSFQKMKQLGFKPLFIGMFAATLVSITSFLFIRHVLT